MTMNHERNHFLGLTIITAICLLLIGQSAMAQISSGGTPKSLTESIAQAAPTVTMPGFDATDFLMEDEQAPKDVAMRFGAPFEVGYDLEQSGLWTDLPDGGRLWRLRIASPNAYSINLIFDQFHMPQGGEFFVYNDGYRYVIGAFNSSNNKPHGMFSTQPVPGDAITLEYFEPAAVEGQGVISIMRVVHAYRNFFGYRDALDAFGSSGSCNNNVACDAEWNDQERGAVMMLTSGGSRYCSGSLINNTTNDGTPYILTANHCGPGPTDMAMFNYQSPVCTPNTDGPTNQTVSGGTELFSHSDSDVSLFRLSSSVPLNYNPYFNGWNANDVPATRSVCIHHPSGDVKKITWDQDAALHSSWSGTPANSHWRIATWEDGTTEPGSSGSPLFDENYRITGQLHGGTASCSNNIDDYYGKFSLSMTLGMRTHLDPGASGVMTLDGYDPNVAGRVVGTVIDAGTLAPLSGVTISVPGESYLTTSNASGDYNLPLPDGTYTIEYSTWAYETHTETGITITEGDTVTIDVSLTALPIITVLSEDYESGAPGWSHSSPGGWGDEWHLSTEDAHGGTSAYKCGDTGTGTYSNLLDAQLVSPILTNLPADAQLSFWMRINSETSGFYADSAYDGGVLEFSVNGGAFGVVTPTPGYVHTFRYTAGGGNPYTGPMPGVPCFAGTVSPWTRYEMDLASYAGDNLQLRFRFGSDGGAADEGWYVDDVLIQAVGEPLVPVTGLTITESGSDVTLRWDDDINPYYRIFSSDVPEGEFTIVEGTTDQVSFTLVGGAADDIRFYYVVGVLTP